MISYEDVRKGMAAGSLVVGGYAVSQIMDASPVKAEAAEVAMVDGYVPSIDMNTVIYSNDGGHEDDEQSHDDSYNNDYNDGGNDEEDNHDGDGGHGDDDREDDDKDNDEDDHKDDDNDHDDNDDDGHDDNYPTTTEKDNDDDDNDNHTTTTEKKHEDDKDECKDDDKEHEGGHGHYNDGPSYVVDFNSYENSKKGDDKKKDKEDDEECEVIPSTTSTTSTTVAATTTTATEVPINPATPVLQATTTMAPMLGEPQYPNIPKESLPKTGNSIADKLAIGFTALGLGSAMLFARRRKPAAN